MKEKFSVLANVKVWRENKDDPTQIMQSFTSVSTESDVICELDKLSQEVYDLVWGARRKLDSFFGAVQDLEESQKGDSKEEDIDNEEEDIDNEE